MKTGWLAYILDTCASFRATSVLLPVPRLVTANCPFVPIVQRSGTVLPTLPILAWQSPETETRSQFQNQWKSQTEGNFSAGQIQLNININTCPKSHVHLTRGKLWSMNPGPGHLTMLATPTPGVELSPRLLRTWDLRSLRIGWSVNDRSWSEALLITRVCITLDQQVITSLRVSLLISTNRGWSLSIVSLSSGHLDYRDCKRACPATCLSF